MRRGDFLLNSLIVHSPLPQLLLSACCCALKGGLALDRVFLCYWACLKLQDKVHLRGCYAHTMSTSLGSSRKVTVSQVLEAEWYHSYPLSKGHMLKS